MTGIGGISNDELSDIAVRKKLVINHPLFTTKVLLPTKPIKDFYYFLQRLVILRDSGHVFLGASGLGKSSAIKYVKGQLKEEMPNAVILLHDALNQQVPSIRAFFMHFLNTASHKCMKGETYILRNRLVNRLIDDARMSNMDLILLFIDEAHAMKMQDFLFLKDVGNALDKEDVKLVTVLIGQSPDFNAVFDELKDEKRIDLINRFARRQTQFPAYTGLEDLQEILRWIDTTHYPMNTEWTWTRFFFCQAYDSGFRMEDDASRFFNAMIRNIEREVKVIPARETFIAIRYLMLEFSCKDCPKMVIPDDVWEAAIKHAGLSAAIGNVNPSAKNNEDN